MKNFGKKITGFLLALITAFGSSASAFAMELSETSEVFVEEFSEEAETFAVSEGESLEEIIREQVEAKTKSIDKKDADGSAKDIIATQGLFGGGKKLSVGEGHALTATIYNSELMREYLTKSFAKIIEKTKKLEFSYIRNVYGNCVWHNNDYNYSTYFSTSEKNDFIYADFVIIPKTGYKGLLNSYDSAMLLIGGSTNMFIYLTITKVTETEITYKFDCTTFDRFDFDTANGGLISDIGALLFTEFDWESKISFEIKVPNNCTHGPTKNYRWTYDVGSKTMISDISGGFSENKATGIASESSSLCYYVLNETVRLYHDKPWVLEYDSKNLQNFALSSVNVSSQYASPEFPFIMHYSGRSTYIWNSERDKESDGYSLIHNYYGTRWGEVITYSKKTVYTIRLENVIEKNGNNMIYLSVLDTASGKILAENIPMDNYYREHYDGGWVFKFKNDSDNYVNGKDFFINYLGNGYFKLNAEHFELRVWENGKDSESASCFEAGKTTAPTCTEKGYTTYTCSLCGYSKKADYKAALGHTFGEWETVTKPTAENPGEEQRKCKNCEHSESRVIPALGYTLSDINLDGSVDVMDAYFARLVAAKLVEPTAKQIEMGDVDLDGKITAIDANIIRKYVIGIINEIPVK